ncbi:DUF4148 domain-containing protein [Burkholderia sp. BCC1993]|uniref:DUF4148 domain-containing protein n=1 Tax=Burkholderia sp. BCC1993 TaxID=2817444 RepID=UPI002AB281CF|nr:DUF4148 domain-containing protein [Burkholderia sp. BCC1993]
MNNRIAFVATAFAALIPAMASAQSTSQGLTREQVRNEMIQYEAAGFNPARANPRTWVNDVQSATMKVTLAQQAHAQFADSGASPKCN